MATDGSSGSDGVSGPPEHVGGAGTSSSKLDRETVDNAPADDSPYKDVWAPALKEAAVAFTAAAVLLVIFYALAFRWIHPEFVPFMDRDATKLIAGGKDFIPVSVGGHRVEGSNAVIEDFNGDEAILALPRAFRAEDYPFIKLNLSGFTRFSKAKILWQQAGDPTTHALEFNRSGDEVTQIAMVYGGEAYSGQINSVALLFYDGPALGFENNNEVDIIIESIEFRPFSAGRVAKQVLEDWTNPPLWRGYSNNIVRGLHSHGMLFPNAVAHLLVVTGVILVALFRYARRVLYAITPGYPVMATVLCLCLSGWIFNDAFRWHWRVEQFKDTRERYLGLPLEERIRNNEVRCSRFPDDCASHLLPYF